MKSRRSVPYPPTEVEPWDGDPVTMQTASATAYLPAMGYLSAPVDHVPRRAIYVGTAYNGLPARSGLTMRGPIPHPRGKTGWAYLRRFPQILAGIDQEGFDVPPIGNVIPSPVFYPPAPVIDSQGPVRVASNRVRRMNPVRRLSALLPNIENTYQPARYGDDYDGDRG